MVFIKILQEFNVILDLSLVPLPEIKKEFWALNVQPVLCKSTWEIIKVFRVN